MPGSMDELYRHINGHQAMLLHCVVLRWSDRAIADAMAIEVSSVRTQLRRLRHRSGTRTKDELRDWWFAHRVPWLQCMARAAGIEAEEAG